MERKNDKNNNNNNNPPEPPSPILADEDVAYVPTHIFFDEEVYLIEQEIDKRKYWNANKKRKCPPSFEMKLGEYSFVKIGEKYYNFNFASQEALLGRKIGCP